MRSNESPVIMLNKVEALSKPETSISADSYRSYLVLPIKISDFIFTSLNDAVLCAINWFFKISLIN